MSRAKKKSRKSKRPKFWIQGVLAKHPKGALHRGLGVPMGEKIPLSLLHKAERAGGKLAKEAYLAETLRGFKRHTGPRKKTRKKSARKKSVSAQSMGR